MSDEDKKQELRALLINCFKEAVEYISKHEENLTKDQAVAIDSIEASDDDFDTVIDNMIEEAEMGGRIEEAIAFYEDFLEIVGDGNKTKTFDQEASTRATVMLNEYRLNI